MIVSRFEKTKAENFSHSSYSERNMEKKGYKAGDYLNY